MCSSGRAPTTWTARSPSCFRCHESVNVELRAEAFDVTNHHNLYIQQSQTDANNYNPGNPQITASKGRYR